MIVWNDFLHDARVLKEAESLQAVGHEVTVHALHTPGITKKAETLPSGVKVERVIRSPLWGLFRRKESGSIPANEGKAASTRPTGGSRQLALAGSRSITHARLLWRLVRARPDVIHAHDVNTLPTAWLASVLVRCPLVYDAHEISTDREGYRSIRKIVGWLEKRLMPVATTITTTEARAKFFARAYLIRRPLVLQNRPRFEIIARTNRIREELGLTEPRPIVIYQGGLQQGRGLERLVDAAKQVEKAYFVFIGGGRLADSLRRRALEAGIADRVRFIPTVPLTELPSYTASADIGVQPIENSCLNHFTTDSNKLFEYMMAGLPVVATRMPEIRRIVSRGEFGLLVPDSDTDALARALNELANDEALRANLGARALETAKSMNWDSQETMLSGLYEQLLGHKVPMTKHDAAPQRSSRASR